MLIDMYPLEEMPYVYYSLFLQNQKRDTEALVEWENLININPKNQGAWDTGLRILSQKQDTVGIVDFTERGIKELPEFAELYFYRSIALFQQKKYAEALEVNELAIKNLESTAGSQVLGSFYAQLDIYYKLETAKSV